MKHNIAKEIETLWHNFSKKTYYFFHQKFEYSWWEIPKIEDFIIPVFVKIIGIIPDKDLLFKLEIKNKDWFFMRINSDELYSTIEDCIEDNKNFLNNWHKETLKNLSENLEKKEKNMIDILDNVKRLKDSIDKLSLIKNWNINNKPIDKIEFLLRCSNAWDKWEVSIKSIVRWKNATEKLLREENWWEHQMTIVNDIVEREKSIAGDRYGKLATDIDLYNISQFFELLLHPCPLCARDKNTWNSRYSFCNHKNSGEEININF